jgi:hypothetical protein
VELPDTLQQSILAAQAVLPCITVVHYQNTKQQSVYYLIQPADAMVEASRWAGGQNCALHFIDKDMANYPRIQEAYPDPFAIWNIGCEAYIMKTINLAGSPTREDTMREQTMAYRLKQLAKRYQTVVCVLGISHWRRVYNLVAQNLAQPLVNSAPRLAQISQITTDSAREILPDIPWLISWWEKKRLLIEGYPNRWQLFWEILQQAAKSHFRKKHQDISPLAIRQIFTFAKKYSHVTARLIPDFFQFLISVRGCTDNDFACEVWETGSYYEFEPNNPSYNLIELKAEDLYQNVQHLVFRKKVEQRRRNLLQVMRQRPHERFPGEWRQKWEKGLSQCSYQPEDLVIENYAHTLMKKSQKALAQQYRHVEEFKTSLLDGVDLRETIRHWWQKKLFVFEEKKMRGKVGALVMIFADDPTGTEYPWTMTWQGEHNQESDMAFYATDPQENLVGPGIGQSIYGGLVMTYPPGRMFQIFSDPYFAGVSSKPELLLLAALDYCQEPIISYVAAKPPAATFKYLAQRMGKKLVYMPIGNLPPKMIKKLRTFHVLRGHDVRQYADQYIMP